MQSFIGTVIILLMHSSKCIKSRVGVKKTKIWKYFWCE